MHCSCCCSSNSSEANAELQARVLGGSHAPRRARSQPCATSLAWLTTSVVFPGVGLVPGFYIVDRSEMSLCSSAVKNEKKKKSEKKARGTPTQQIQAARGGSIMNRDALLSTAYLPERLAKRPYQPKHIDMTASDKTSTLRPSLI